MRASKIIHKGVDRIKLEFPNTMGNNNLVRKIEDSRWSKTIGAWHIPYTKAAIEELMIFFPGVECSDLKPINNTYHQTDTEEAENGHILQDAISKYQNQGIEIEIGLKKIFLKMPNNEADIGFIRSLKYVFWDKTDYRWVITNYGKNLELMKTHFGNRVTKLAFIKEEPKPIITVILHPPFEGELPELDAKSLEEIACFQQWMEHKRYSESTIKTYLQAIQIFLRFIKPKSSADATNDDMIKFVHQYMLPRKLSLSYQNQAINSARLFFKTIQGSKLITEQIERPRREHKLPNVLSKEEVKAILEAPANTKHRSMLSLIYACGLRRSELLNLKPEHIDSKRHLLIILNAKGKKDRVVPISDKVIEMLRYNKH